jgi:hypothetical protein
MIAGLAKRNRQMRAFTDTRQVQPAKPIQLGAAPLISQ